MREILIGVIEAVKIPVIGAGGVIDGFDAAEVLKMGAAGVQMGTRFALSEECNAAAAFKQYLLDAKAENTVFVQSPVGLTGRAIVNDFTRMLEKNENVGPICL